MILPYYNQLLIEGIDYHWLDQATSYQISLLHNTIQTQRKEEADRIKNIK